jgi:hypothetical protein
MPSERAARDDSLVAAEHIRRLMSITDALDERIPGGWLSTEEAEQALGLSDGSENTGGSRH